MIRDRRDERAESLAFRAMESFPMEVTRISLLLAEIFWAVGGVAALTMMAKTKAFWVGLISQNPSGQISVGVVRVLNWSSPK